jgi:Ca-activated chloride channel family protein
MRRMPALAADLKAQKSRAPIHLLRVLVLAGILAIVGGCGKTNSSSPSSEERLDPEKTLSLLFTYGSEKEAWVKSATEQFHRGQPKTASGKLIRVSAVPKGSGECIDELVSGTTQAHLTSPASAAFIKLGNAQSRAKAGGDLIGQTDNLVLSPVVIAMWQPMAETLGWPGKPVGWSDILALASEARGWESRGKPQWGQFRFGHTHPQYSNSGLISLIAEVYAAAGKRAGITAEEIARPETARFVANIEKSVVHYGSSTGFFGRKMFSNGPQYVSAAVLYENMVIESYQQRDKLAFPLVAIYPKEGTFWSDHPVGIVERPWVTPEHREAARQYISFLLAREQQQKAMEFGFRPALPDVALAAPIDPAHGVNPKEPQTTLETPGAGEMDAILRLWQANKKRSNVTLVIDVSGSMKENNRIQNARLGAQELVRLLGENDWFRLVPFNNQVFRTAPAAAIGKGRDQMLGEVGSLIASGGTALYDAIAAAYDEQLKLTDANRDKISAIVVLTDGADTDSKTKLSELLDRIRFDNELRTIRVFTIGYDSGAKREALEQIANATQAKFYEGKPENIREVFKDISTFF